MLLAALVVVGLTAWWLAMRGAIAAARPPEGPAVVQHKSCGFVGCDCPCAMCTLARKDRAP